MINRNSSISGMRVASGGKCTGRVIHNLVRAWSDFTEGWLVRSEGSFSPSQHLC